MLKRSRNVLVTIDPQKDFVLPDGALSVANAQNSADRLVEFINGFGSQLIDLCAITLDSHQKLHIAHASAWFDIHGNHPKPFTIIKPEDVDTVWFMVPEPWKGYAKDYTTKLAQNGRFALCIWPDHCLIGTPGHTIYSPLADAYYSWQIQTGKLLNFLTKGSHFATEHYSAVRAEIPFVGGHGYDPDPKTQTAISWLNMLSSFDKVIFGGWALSHCLRFTVEDTIEQFGPDSAKKIILVSDFSSCVVTPTYDFTPETEAWLKTVGNIIQVVKSQDLPQLLKN